MLVRRTDPYRQLTAMRRDVDALFGRGLGRYFDNSSEELSTWVPALDVIEQDDQILLRAELPGLTQDEVDITLENGTLTLKGDKKFEHEETSGNYRRLESRYGSFYRSVSLPNSVDQDRVDAAFRNGVLEITLPKAERAKPKKIAVKVQ